MTSPLDALPTLAQADLPVINRTATVNGTAISFVVVAWIAVSLRVHARFNISKVPGWDDAFVSLALVVSTLAITALCLTTQHGLGQHLLSLSVPQLGEYAKLVYYSSIGYVTSSMLIKISILLQYLRFFTTKNRPKVRLFVITVLVLVVMWGLFMIFGTIFSCVPIRGTWAILDHNSSEYHCVLFTDRDPMKLFAAHAAYSASNMFLDMVTLGIPLPFWRDFASRDKNSKVALFGLFSIGTVAVAFSALRLGVIVHTRAGYFPDLDYTWYDSPIFIASALEIQVAILCASIPIFWPIIPAVPWGKIFVLSEYEVRTEHHGLQHREPDVESLRWSYDTNKELQEAAKNHQQTVTIRDWRDPMEVHMSGSRFGRPWSTRIERAEPSASVVELTSMDAMKK